MSVRFRIAAGVALVLVVIAVRVLVSHGYDGYTVDVLLKDAGGLQKGSNVNVNGTTVGTVANLTVTRDDLALAVVHLDKQAAPVGADAHATVEIDGFFGERLLDLSRGDYKVAAKPSGYTIPTSESGVSVRLDNVLDALNMDAQGALQTFLDEQGDALVGRGQDLQTVLAELPQTLPQLTSLMDQFSSNQRALADLVTRSDQVVTEVAGQRRYLGSMVRNANGALGALASRRDDLGATVQNAPGALKQAQDTLAVLQGTAEPLAPAADGLRATAPSLLSALKELPAFTRAAVPTLDEVSAVSPALDGLAADGTPIVAKLVPLTSELTRYSSQAVAPLATMLANDGGAENLFGEMEGWARSTQGYDAAGHVFRFGATVSEASFEQLLSALSVPGLPALHRQKTATATPSAPSTASKPSTPVTNVGQTLHTVTSGVGTVVSKTLGAVGGTVSGIVSKVTGALHLGSSSGGHTGTTTTATTTTTTPSGSSVGSLLNYLMGK